MFLFDWFYALMYSLGFWQKSATVVFLDCGQSGCHEPGLDNAGKTTLMYKLKDGTFTSFIPTQRPQIQEMSLRHGTADTIKDEKLTEVVPLSMHQRMGQLSLKAWDLGGHQVVRQLWRDYYLEANAIIFMVDSADVDRLTEARDELHHLMEDPSLPVVPVAVLANKKDLAWSVSMEEIIQALDLGRFLASDSKRPFALFRTSVLEGTGYPEAFQWLNTLL